MTKTEIIAHAARELGDTSDSFKTDIVKPSLELVLMDLAQADCLDLRRTATFRTVEGQRNYAVREITGGAVHQAQVLEVRAYPWGKVVEKKTPSDFADLRMSQGEAAKGRFVAWAQWPDRSNIEFTPPCDADNVGVEIQVVYESEPQDIPDNDDLHFLMKRELPTVIAGIKARCAGFAEDTAQQLVALETLYQQGKAQMYGRLHNDRPGRITPGDGW